MTHISTRLARQYTLLDPSDCDPPHGLDLTNGSRDSQKVGELEEAFRKNGFDKTKSALVGYPLNGRVQLASGTHRHEAARRAGILLPVNMQLRSIIEAAWGTPAWMEVIKDISVQDLELAPVKEGGEPPGLNERVDLSGGYT